MKMSLEVNEELLRAAESACGASSPAETVNLGLQALVRQAAYQRLASYGGSEPDARDVPRRREAPTAEREA